MVLAVAKALQRGATSVICASTGNTSASAAAYAAAAGMTAVVVLPRGRIAAGKLLQAQVAGARIVAIDGNFDDALRIVRELAEAPGAAATRRRARPRSSTRSIPSVSRARRPPPSRSATTSAMRPMCSRSRSATPATSAPIGPGSASTPPRAGDSPPATRRVPGRRRSTARPRPSGRAPRDRRHRDPDRQPRIVDEGDRRARRIRRHDRGRERRGDPRRPARPRQDRGDLLRACVRGVRGRGPAHGRGGTPARDETVVCVLTGNGLKDPETPAARLPPLLVADARTDDVRRALGW